MPTKMQDLMARAREELRYEPFERRVRAHLGDRPIIDSTRALLVWEPRRICPSFAVPVEDMLVEFEPAPATNGEVEGVLHPGIPFAVHTAAGSPVAIGGGAGPGSAGDLAGYVALDFTAFDWYEEDERIFGHPRDPYNRVDVRASSRAVRIELDGEVRGRDHARPPAVRDEPAMRFYLPSEDVRGELCRARSEAIARTRARRPTGRSGPPRTCVVLRAAAARRAVIAGLVAFWNERVDIFVDGERWTPPSGPIAKALADEFGV